jgi:hypothetical protein
MSDDTTAAPPSRPKIDHIARAPIYIGICVFLMQMLTQFSLFFQLPEKVKMVLRRLDVIEEYASQGKALHAQREAEVASLRHLIEQREEAGKLMQEDDRTQWEAIRELDRRIDGLEKGKQ